jgi:putative transposase
VLTDAQWQAVAPLLPPPRPGGRPRTVDARAILEAILYATEHRLPWRKLPAGFPAWSTVYAYYQDWRDDGTLDHVRSSLG